MRLWVLILAAGCFEGIRGLPQDDDTWSEEGVDKELCDQLGDIFHDPLTAEVASPRTALHSGAAFWRGDPSELGRFDGVERLTRAGDLDNDGHADLVLYVDAEPWLLAGALVASGTLVPLTIDPLLEPKTHFIGPYNYDIEGDGKVEALILADDGVRVYDGAALLAGEMVWLETLPMLRIAPLPSSAMCAPKI